jgi:hypothetical protein
MVNRLRTDYRLRNNFHLIRQLLIITLVFSSVNSFAQKDSKWQLSLQLQPEMAIHKNQYSFRSKETFNKETFNSGLASILQYNLTEQLFIDAGIAFISRKLKALAFIDQSLLPSPYYDSTKPLYSAKSIALRTLQFPIGIGISVIKTAKGKIFVKATYIINYLLNAKYDVNNYPAFKKNYKQGYSLNAGIGMDYRLNNKISLSGSLMYSLKNTVTKDSWLFSQDEHPIALPHTYLQLSAGIKLNLSSF